MQCIHGTPFTMVVRALAIVLLVSFVVTLSGLPTYTDTGNTKEDELFAEILSLPIEERNVTVYIVNLFAVKNSSDETSGEILDNKVAENIPNLVIDPFASVLLVVTDEEKDKQSPVDLDEVAEEFENQGIKVYKIDLDDKLKVLKMEMNVKRAQNIIELASKPTFEEKGRRKRTICMKCGGGGYGGYGGGGGGYGGGGYGGRPIAVIPVVVVPIAGGAGHYRRGGGGQYYPSGGGGGHYPGGGGGGHYPSGGGGGHYPSGGGCSTCGGGGGGSYSQASASAQASSGSWGGK